MSDLVRVDTTFTTRPCCFPKSAFRSTPGALHLSFDRHLSCLVLPISTPSLFLQYCYYWRAGPRKTLHLSLFFAQRVSLIHSRLSIASVCSMAVRSFERGLSQFPIIPAAFPLLLHLQHLPKLSHRSVRFGIPQPLEPSIAHFPVPSSP